MSVFPVLKTGQARTETKKTTQTRLGHYIQDKIQKRKVQHGHTVISDANYTVDHSTDRTVLLYLKRIDGFSKEYV